MQEDSNVTIGKTMERFTRYLSIGLSEGLRSRSALFGSTKIYPHLVVIAEVATCHVVAYAGPSKA